MKYRLMIEDLVTSQLYFEVLEIEFPEYISNDGMRSWKPTKKIPYLTIDTKREYIHATTLKYAVDKEVDTFKEFREIVIKHKDKIKSYEDI